MKLCFTTYVFGWYQDFIPIYIYSILQAFPQHYVKIFLHENLTFCNKKALEFITNKNYEIVENCQERNETKIPRLPALRFVMPKEYFQDFDYIYFGDVDFIIYNFFNDNFYEHYVKHCNQTGLPFSNEWNYDYSRYRATGLHFVIKEPYYKVMNDKIKEMRIPDGNYFRSQTPNEAMYDEQMLYYMLCFSFDLRPLIGYLRPLHGLHFGTFRIVDKSHSLAISRIHSDEKIYLPIWRNDIDKIEPILSSDIVAFIEKNGDPRTKETIEKTKYILYKKCFL